MITRAAALALVAVALAACSSGAHKTSALPSFEDCAEAWNAPGNYIRRERVAHVIVPGGYTRAAIMLSVTIGGVSVQNPISNPIGYDVIFYRQRRWVSYTARRDGHEFRFPYNLPLGHDSDRGGILPKFVQRGPSNATITHDGKLLLRDDWDNKISGLAVNIGSRICGLARPSEVLASQTIKDLVAGAGLRFEDRGAHQLKGVPGEWRLFTLQMD